MVKELVTNEMDTMVEEALNEALCRTSHNAQSGVQSVVCKVFEQVMLDSLCEKVIGETLNAHIGKLFDRYEAAEGRSKKLLTSTSFIAPIATFLRRKRILLLRRREVVPPH